ncbi:MAG: hypothetical protein RQ741_07005 [Wenzhouxiangellaceae bacterium]|nr:hypothetical protein [Wenzhouxiangellaceae bacterium]
MFKLQILIFPVAAALLALAMTAFGQEESPVEVAAERAAPVRFVTEHQGRFNGQALRYRATAGETWLRDADGQPRASIFSFAYTREDVDSDAPRPVTFLWNGGPGSASLWLHMGTFGPRRVAVPSDAAHPGPPPYAIVDATETLLDVTDLVFVDPVGTGFSQALGDHEGKEFWGLTEDAQSMAEFIRAWITENGRWNDPRYLVGESFGTTRAAAVADLLEGADFSISLNGMVFVSQALDYAGSTPYVRDNMISHVTYLPSMAAAAWYHGQVEPRPAELEPFLQQARDFAVDELLPALFKGNTLAVAERDSVAGRLAYFTGLSREYIERANLRVQGFRFAKQLLRDQGLVIGLLDARYTRDDIDDLAAQPEADASGDAISAAYKAALMTHMRETLEIDWERLYRVPADPELSPSWNWRTAPEGTPWEPGYVNTARQLSNAMRTNPALEVLVASGYYDLVTPFFDAEYTLGRHDIDAERIHYRYYDGGHMMYVNEPSRTRLLEDTRAFIEKTLGGEKLPN